MGIIPGVPHFQVWNHPVYITPRNGLENRMGTVSISNYGSFGFFMQQYNMSSTIPEIASVHDLLFHPVIFYQDLRMWKLTLKMD